MDILEIRVFEGRNVWNHRPVIEARLALSSAEQVATDSLPDFTRKLVQLLPGLREHSCGRGYPGGFCERLSEGTYLAHVVEHTALELQAAAGYPVGYGKTVRVEGFRLWQLAFEYGTPELGAAALRVAVGLISGLLRSEESFPIGERIAYLQRIAEATLPGPSTASILEACRQRGIPVLPLAGGALYQLGYGCHRKLIEATITSQTSMVAVDSAGDKMLTKEILAGHRLPVPRALVSTGWEEAREAAEELGFPVAVKPCHGNQGKGVSLGLVNWKEFEAAYRIAAGYDRQVLVEEYRAGRHYRLLVIAGQMVAAAERLPATVIGDGEHTINELIELANRDPRRGEGHSRALTKLKLDPVGLLDLGRQGYSPLSRPPQGREVVLRRNANLSTGGSAADVTDLVHPEQRRLAEEAALLLGLDVAGVDLVTADISRSPDASTALIEVNAAPGFRMHLAPERGRPRPVGKALVDYLFPPGSLSSIPLVAVTGTNGKTTTTRMLGHLFKQCGVKVGMTTTGGIYINGRCVLTGDTTGPASARLVLSHPEVEMAILETARGGILRGGLGYDLSDVAVVTNIGPDHLGQEGIETIEDLCWVKSLVVEAVHDNGYVILNADDPYCQHFASRARGEVIYFSLSGDNKVLLRHLGAGGRAVYVTDGSVYIGHGEQTLRLIGVKSIRSAMGGRAKHNLENAMAAAAAAYACGLSPALIRKGLHSFGIQSEDNPGRLMLRRVGRVNVIVDYGHNAPAFRQIIEFARTLKPRRLVGVIGVPGDRRDDQIIAGGEVAGRGFDYIYIKEDSDLRGRAPGETARLLYTGVRRAGLAAEAVEVIPEETAAVAKALEQSRPGDLIVIFYELLEPVNRLLEEAGRREEEAVLNRAAEK